jgi:thiamine-phosphate pyrophosphorylase
VVTVLSTRKERLKRARLALVLSAGDLGPLDAALAGGVDLVVLRDETPTLEAAEAFRDATAAFDALLVVTDRPDMALACGADGVHAEQLPIAEARRLAGAELLVGYSIRSAHETVVPPPADYLFVGPIFETPTKPGWAALGLEAVRLAAEGSPVPFFAIGGIDATNAGDVVAAGARRLAVVRAIRDAADPAETARLLRLRTQQ